MRWMRCANDTDAANADDALSPYRTRGLCPPDRSIAIDPWRSLSVSALLSPSLFCSVIVFLFSSTATAATVRSTIRRLREMKEI